MPKENFANISYWRFNKKAGNFGDELNVPVGKFLFGEKVTFKKELPKSILLIGSNLGDIQSGQIACGVGLHHHSQQITRENLKNAEFRCVRGPLSLQYLKSHGVFVKDIYLGDPALLLPMFYKPKIDPQLKSKIGVVPHISNVEYFQNQIGKNKKFLLIDPCENWESVINKICSCEKIISSSLHGLICADAFKKPNVWIKVRGKSIPPCDKNTDYGDFKYWDYFLSQGREVKFINYLFQDLENKIYDGGNNIDLFELKKSILV